MRRSGQIVRLPTGTICRAWVCVSHRRLVIERHLSWHRHNGGFRHAISLLRKPTPPNIQHVIVCKHSVYKQPGLRPTQGVHLGRSWAQAICADLVQCLNGTEWHRAEWHTSVPFERFFLVRTITTRSRLLQTAPNCLVDRRKNLL